MVPLLVAVVLIAGCPNDKDLMWCLKLKADSKAFLLPDGRIQFVPNEAMIEYAKRLRGR